MRQKTSELGTNYASSCCCSPGNQRNTSFQINRITPACISDQVSLLSLFLYWLSNQELFSFSGVTSIPSAPAMCLASCTRCELLPGASGAYPCSGPKIPLSKSRFFTNDYYSSCLTHGLCWRQSMSTLAWWAWDLDVPTLVLPQEWQLAGAEKSSEAGSH